MRALSIAGFMARYVQELANSNTLNVHKLYDIVKNGNFRLKEPLFLYCFYADKGDTLLKYAYDADITEYLGVSDLLKQERISELSRNYKKAIEAYEYQRDRYSNEVRIKSLMAQKIKRIQREKNVTNYRIYTDLHINAGNFNDFIKNQKYNKLSLEKSREVIAYLERV